MSQFAISATALSRSRHGVKLTVWISWEAAQPADTIDYYWTPKAVSPFDTAEEALEAVEVAMDNDSPYAIQPGTIELVEI